MRKGYPEKSVTLINCNLESRVRQHLRVKQSANSLILREFTRFASDKQQIYVLHVHKSRQHPLGAVYYGETLPASYDPAIPAGVRNMIRRES